MNFKKLTQIALGSFLCLSVGLSMVGCGEEPVKTTGVKRNPPEGREQKYDGFYSTVHWEENKTTGKYIYSRLFRPDDFDESKRYPILVMSHGYNSVGMDGSSFVVQNAIANGMICITYDFCGGGKLTKSDGKPTEMSVKTEISDLETIVDYVCSLSYIDNSKLALFAHSYGGLVSCTVAARHPEKVAALCVHAPALSMFDGIHERFGSIDQIPETIKMNNLEVGKKFYADAWDFDVWSEIGNYDKDVFMMCGSKDGLLVANQKAQGIYGEDRATLYVVEGAAHDFSPEQYKEAFTEGGGNDYLRKMGVIQ
ncbi:MAG: alpha/beta fold hydrolase [Clostridia bacterium]|nr:alpha/beta fold hydrolase [Clostridia bacterium]